jgi:hypothetical protein
LKSQSREPIPIGTSTRMERLRNFGYLMGIKPSFSFERGEMPLFLLPSNKIDF